MTAPELKPCPFCGGSLIERHAGWFDHPKGKCVLSGRAFHKGFIGQWNTRATRATDPALTAAQAEIARLTAERDAAMAGRVKVKPLWWCDPCRAVGMVHCSDPESCGCMMTADAEADGWKSWLDDLPLPDGFRPGVDRLQDFITRILAALQPDTERAEPVACPCTMFEQDESCPEGYPSLLCGVCNGTGTTSREKVAALAAEMLRIANDLGEPEDPFVAWGKMQHLNAAPSPQAREITVQEAEEVPEVKAMADEASYWVNNPSAWDNYDDGASEVIRRLVDALRAIADMQKGG